MIVDKSVRALINSAEIALEQNDINAALRLVHDFVNKILTEPICAAQVFASQNLDKLCLRIGRHSLTNLTTQTFDYWPDRKKNRQIVVYLVSRLQRSGGHSRLVQDFIHSQPLKDHLILSTEVGGPSDKDYFDKLFSTIENVRFVTAPNASFEAQLAWLQNLLLISLPVHVYLFNHHQDSVAVAAVVPELELDGSFCHHGDHHLCLGVHLSHLVHIDFHPMGYHYCRYELGVDNRYLPLTFEDKGYIPVLSEFASGGCITTATAARSNKIEIPYYVSYLDTIPQILKVTGGRHIHIGKLTPWGLRRIHVQMRKNGVPKERFIYIEWIPSVWKYLQENKVDIYIASFPYGAGLTLIEAMGAGIPVIMHQHMFSRVLGGLELAYSEAFSWADPKELFEYLSTISSERLECEKRISRQQYETYHHPKILSAYLQAPEFMQLPIPPLNSKYKPRLDEWAAWAESQLSFSRLFFRFTYRILRRLRSVLS